MSPRNEARIREFVGELATFAVGAESMLSEAEQFPGGRKALLERFAGMMITIRGTAVHLGFENVSRIATIGEEIAVKGADLDSNSKLRKCIGSLWDVVTTVKYLIEHQDQETGEEQEILEHRLESTLGSLGGARARVGQDEIEALLRGRS